MHKCFINNLRAKPLQLLALPLSIGLALQLPSAAEAFGGSSIKKVKCSYSDQGKEKIECHTFDTTKGQLFEYDDFAEALNPVKMSGSKRFTKVDNQLWNEEVEKAYKIAITGSGKIKYNITGKTFWEKHGLTRSLKFESVIDLNTMNHKRKMVIHSSATGESLKNISGKCQYVKPDSTKVTKNWKYIHGF